MLKNTVIYSILSVTAIVIFAVILSSLKISRSATSQKKIKKVSFDQSMAPSTKIGVYKSSMSNYDKEWHTARKLYEKNIITDFNYSKKTRIPNIIHQIYVGNPVPERCKVYQKTWKEYHPKWQYYLWTDKEIDDFGLYNRALYDATPNLAQKSDIARYEILYRFGGLYVDMDFECIKPFDILHHGLDFYAGIEFNKNLRVNNALIGSKPGHPILKSCIKNLRNNKELVFKKELTPIQKYIETIVQQAGPAYFTKIIFEYLNSDNINNKNNINNKKNKIVLFPNTYFYPFNVGMLIKIFPETFAIHHWHMSWLKNPKITRNKNKI